MNDYNSCTAKTEIENMEKRADRQDNHTTSNFKTLYKETKSNRELIMKTKNDFTIDVNKAVNDIKGMIIKFFFGIMATFTVGVVIFIIVSIGS